jgi:biotin synthase
MIGIPGQSIDDLADDILRCAELDLDMIAAGPYIPHSDTPLGQMAIKKQYPGNQVIPSPLMAYKTIALLRILCPDTNIPSTSALSAMDITHGCELGLMRGANVFMPNMTPLKYRRLYEIYPGRAKNGGDYPDPARIQHLLSRIERQMGKGPGPSNHYTAQFINN